MSTTVTFEGGPLDGRALVFDDNAFPERRVLVVTPVPSTPDAPPDVDRYVLGHYDTSGQDATALYKHEGRIA
ncbi:MAG: hypothetical protein ACYCU0_00855 [Solirubrobacteraceae bacterium]